MFLDHKCSIMGVWPPPYFSPQRVPRSLQLCTTGVQHRFRKSSVFSQTRADQASQSTRIKSPQQKVENQNVDNPRPVRTASQPGKLVLVVVESRPYPGGPPTRHQVGPPSGLPRNTNETRWLWQSATQFHQSHSYPRQELHSDRSSSTLHLLIMHTL